MTTNISKIKSVPLNSQTNAKHNFFAMIVVEQIRANAYIGTEFKKASDAVIAAFEREDLVYQRIDRTWLTGQMSQADKERTSQFLMFLAFLRAYLRNTNHAMVVAAEKLLKVGDLYGGVKIGNQHVLARSANLTNFLQDLSNRYSEEVELLSLGEAEQKLREFNDQYMSLHNERLHDRTEFGLNAMSEARQQTDKYIRILFSSVNNAIDLGDWVHVKDFVETVNAQIDELLSGTGSGKPDESEETEVVEEVTLTFLKADETAITLTGLPGESYEIPPLPEGWIWISAEDEVHTPNGIFPAEDAVFIEVALGERKSVVFHFLSGEHETFYGLPGTEYIVPGSSDGCYWEPQPTGRIPEVDTQYFETVAPELDERPKYRITFRAEGRVVAVQEYYEGETIVPPTCPEGFEWPDDMPEVMPARNFVVLGVESD